MKHLRELLQYHLFSGHAWFTAAVIVAVVATLDLLSLLARKAWYRSVARSALLVAVGIAYLSGTVLPSLFVIPLLVAVLVYGATIGRVSEDWRRIATVLVFAFAVAAFAFEARFHRDPVIPPDTVQDIVVVGDSLASGGFGERDTWPHIVARNAHLKLCDMSVAAQSTAQALADYGHMLPRLAPASLVIIEVGGNDFLGEATPESYARGLDGLLAAACAATPNVFVVELPVIPGARAYGGLQREIVARREAKLIPKHHLAAVLADPANTTDGIHLTQRGHDELARRIGKLLKPS
ncbi:MAG: SGNH/GDSL hydrolase family protein [Thermoanaerobaculia bacterium]